MSGMKNMNGVENMNKMKGMGGMDMQTADTSKKSNDAMNGMDDMDMMPEMPAGTFSYSQLKALNPTTLDSTLPWREIKLTLTGNMLRYVWSFDDKTLSESDLIKIKKGENVRFVLYNNTMMRHPLHLHGHFFRFLNGQGEYSPMKHTFDIKPMETVTIEFEANEEKDWFFHCHILYHMMSGMARIVSYEGSDQNEYAKTKYKNCTWSSF